MYDRQEDGMVEAFIIEVHKHTEWGGIVPASTTAATSTRYAQTTAKIKRTYITAKPKQGKKSIKKSPFEHLVNPKLITMANVHHRISGCITIDPVSVSPLTSPSAGSSSPPCSRRSRRRPSPCDAQCEECAGFWVEWVSPNRERVGR